MTWLRPSAYPKFAPTVIFIPCLWKTIFSTKTQVNRQRHLLNYHLQLIVRPICFTRDGCSLVSPKRQFGLKFFFLTIFPLVQDASPNPTISTSQSKWTPKFAVVYKHEKCVLLYDDEPISPHNLGGRSKPSKYSQAINVRLDNSVQKENFLNFWRNKSEKFDFQVNESRSNEDILRSSMSEYNSKSGSSNYLNANNVHHHLSNRDIGNLSNLSFANVVLLLINQN